MGDGPLFDPQSELDQLNPKRARAAAGSFRSFAFLLTYE